LWTFSVGQDRIGKLDAISRLPGRFRTAIGCIGRPIGGVRFEKGIFVFRLKFRGHFEGVACHLSRVYYDIG